MYETDHSMAKSSASLVKLHRAYTLAGKTEAADARIEQWLKEAPDDAFVRQYIGGTHIKSGRYAEAVVQYERLTKVQPDNAILLNNLAWLYARA